MSDQKQTTITINGWDAEQIERVVAAKIDGLSHEVVSNRLDVAIRERLERLIDDVAATRIREAVDGLFAEGWQPTNDMGAPTGPRISLAERVRRVLDRKDHYGSGGTMIEKIIEQATKTGLDAVIRTETASATQKLRTAFDDVIKARFAETLRKAMGMG